MMLLAWLEVSKTTANPFSVLPTWRDPGDLTTIEDASALDQIKAARLTRDYDPEYVTPASFVKADHFVEAIYRDLTRKR